MTKQSSRNNKVRRWRNFIYLDSGVKHRNDKETRTHAHRRHIRMCAACNIIYLDSGGHHPQNLSILRGPNKPRNESKRSAGCGKDVSPQATRF